MKKTQKVILFILFVFTVRVIISCCDCNPYTETFDITSFEVHTIDNTGSYPMPSNDTLFKDAIAFELWIGNNEFQEFACLKNSFPVFNEIQACECKVYYKLKYSIDSIKAFSNKELSFVYPANSDLSNKFYATDVSNGNPGSLYQTLAELAEQINTYELINSMMYKFQLVLDKIYISSDQTSFTFTFYFSNGEQFSATTPEVYLKNQNQ